MTKPTKSARMRVALLPATLLTVLLAGCGGGGNDAASPQPNVPPATTLAASASASQILAGSRPVALSATVSDTTQVTWQLAAGSPGSLSATSGAQVNYVPPANGVAVPTPVIVTANAGTASKSLRLTVYPDPGTARLELLAGTPGSRVQLDGTGTAARFENIATMAVDTHGNALVVDNALGASTRSALRRISAAGVVTTLSRLPFGHADGDAAHAQTGLVSSIAPAANGTLYLLDRDEALRVRALHPDGSVTTILEAAQVDQSAVQLLTAADGTLYLLTPYRVLRIAGGTTTVVAGASDLAPAADGVGAGARFAGIADGVIGADGVLYVINDHGVRSVALATGQVTTIAGLLTDTSITRPIVDGTGSSARFAKPSAIALSPDGELLVLDRSYPTPGVMTSSQAVLRRVTRAGTVTTLARMPEQSAAGEPSPGSPSMHTLLRTRADGSLLLASAGEIRRGAVSGNFTPFAGLEGDTVDDVDGPAASARLMRPSWIAADQSGTLYVSDAPGTRAGGQPDALEEPALRIRKITWDGAVSTIVKQDGVRANGMAVAANGDLYVGVRPPRVVRFPGTGGYVLKVSPDGTSTIVAGGIGREGDGTPADGTGTAAHFGEPFVAGVDVDGNVYVNDKNRGTALVRKVSPAGVVTTVAALPAGLKAAPDGNVYSVDSARHVVLRTAPDGTSTVVAGVPDTPGPRLGTLPGLLYRPVDIVPVGPAAFAVVTGGAVLKLVLPH